MLFDTIVVKYRNCMIDVVLIFQSTVKVSGGRSEHAVA